MPLEVISVLEKKIDTLLDTVRDLRGRNEQLQSEAEAKQQTIKRLESENHRLTEAVDSFKGESEDSQKKLDSAAERIQGIIAKLEAVS